MHPLSPAAGEELHMPVVAGVRYVGRVPEPVIVAHDLVKTYRGLVAVDGISFEVAPGESFGLLGPNGAGKSTTMGVVGAVSTRTSGDLRILGLDPDAHGPEIRSQLGVVPQA